MNQINRTLAFCSLFVLVFSSGSIEGTARTAPFQSGSEARSTGYFLTTLGHDTIAVERYILEAGSLHGTSVIRAPRTTVREYDAVFDSAGDLKALHVMYIRGGALASTREYAYYPDSVRVTIKQDTSVSRSTFVSSNHPYPLFIDIFGIWQAGLRQALLKYKNTFEIFAGKNSLKYNIESRPGGKYDLINPTGDFTPLHAEIDAGGLLQRFDMTATTDKFMVQRIPSADVDAIAKEFAAREKAGGAAGVLSPRDTVRAEINGAHLMIDYGRPSARGRIVFGGIVPWDSVWRTGANAATQFMTDKEVNLGTVTVPPGTYTFFTVPGKDQWMFIINSQHGQWGTQYDKAKDLARIPFKVTQSKEFRERFQFEIVPGGAIRFAWENTVGEIPLKVP